MRTKTAEEREQEDAAFNRAMSNVARLATIRGCYGPAIRCADAHEMETILRSIAWPVDRSGRHATERARFLNPALALAESLGPRGESH